MSYVGAIPVDPGPVSDSHLLIDAALESVRRTAGLDDSSVLPSIESIVPKTPPTTLLFGAPTHSLPSAEAIVRSSAKPISRRDTPTFRTARRASRRVPWLVVLCGVVAVCSAFAAVLKSPIGERPGVRSAVTNVKLTTHRLVSTIW